MTTQSDPAQTSLATGVPIGRLLRMKDVERETSLHRATIYRRIAEGSFPAPIRLTAQRVAWSETAVEQWKTQQLQACSA